MIFFLFGGGTRYKNIGTAEVRTCSRCHNSAPWIRLQRFHEVTLFFIPVARWGRRELMACAVCGEADDLPGAERLRPRQSRDESTQARAATG